VTRDLVPACRMALVTLVLTGLVYPLAVTAAAGILFPRQAAGSLVRIDGRVVGSELIAQRFSDPGYFQPRPSAAGKDGWDATASGGSNLGPTSRRLRDRMEADLARLRAENPSAAWPPPVELVSASASGLDPDLSPEGARWQIPRVAAARGVAPGEVEAILARRVEGRTLGFLGEPRVNVLLLNLDLDHELASGGGSR
jgi:K+-transporting ATPase ATPase C chain